MAHTQFEPRHRTVNLGELLAFAPVILLVLWVVARSIA